MKNTILTAAVLLLSITNSFSQKKTGHFTLNFGSSIPTGEYSDLAFDADAYNAGAYPFKGGGASNGFNLGLSYTYYVSKNLGFMIDYQYVKNSILSNPRYLATESYFGEELSAHDIRTDDWKYNFTFLGSVASFPLLEDKLFIDAKIGIGIASFRSPLIEESIITNSTLDTYEYSSESYVTLATKLELQIRYFFNNIGVGLFLNTTTAYNSSSEFDVKNEFTVNMYTSTYDSSKTFGFNSSVLNYGLNLSYRFK